MPTNTEKIETLLKTTSSFEENLRVINRDPDGLRKDLSEVEERIHELDNRVVRIEESLRHFKERLDRSDPSERLARVEESLKALREKLDQSDSRRFDIIKLFVGALVASIIGGAVGAGYQWLPKVFESMRTHRGSPAEKP